MFFPHLREKFFSPQIEAAKNEVRKQKEKQAQKRLNDFSGSIEANWFCPIVYQGRRNKKATENAASEFVSSSLYTVIQILERIQRNRKVKEDKKILPSKVRDKKEGEEKKLPAQAHKFTFSYTFFWSHFPPSLLPLFLRDYCNFFSSLFLRELTSGINPILPKKSLSLSHSMCCHFPRFRRQSPTYWPRWTKKGTSGRREGEAGADEVVGASFLNGIMEKEGKKERKNFFWPR